jgi:hypothetical protein
LHWRWLRQVAVGAEPEPADPVGDLRAVSIRTLARSPSATVSAKLNVILDQQQRIPEMWGVAATGP